MPIYEFRCKSCGQITAEHHSISSEIPSMIDCNQEGCGDKAVRVFSAPAVIYKGKGFYTTDYARKSGKGTKEEKPPQEVKKDADKSKEPSKSKE